VLLESKYTCMRTHPLSMFLPGFEVMHMHYHGNHLTIDAAPTAPSVACPTCAATTSSVHSYYRRTPRDLPVFGAAVKLQLHVRRFRCKNPACAVRTFSEPLPALLPPRAHRTHRFTEHLRALALALGGEAGARYAACAGISVSPDTLLRVTRAIVLPERPTPRVLSVDDWALRKGRLYGTILVDGETHRPIDLIKDRTAEQFAAWLTEHNPTAIEVITRDRSRDYALGAEQAVPHACQVADRWHLLRNLSDMLDRMLVRLRTSLQQRLTAARMTQGVTSAALSIYDRETRRAHGDQQRQQHRDAARAVLHSQIHALHEQGAKIIQIARQLHISRQTVRRYLSSTTYPETVRRPRQRSILDPYAAYLHGRWAAGCQQTKDLLAEIQAQGYRGSVRPLVQWTMLRRELQRKDEPQPETRDAAGNDLPDRLPATRRLVWQVLQPTTALEPAEQRLVAELLAEPELAVTYALAQRFRRMVQQRQPEELDRWLTDARTSGIRELETFAEGLQREYDSIKAALELPYSNGPTEGQVTRLKQLRRAMYGRGSFELIRKRFLATA
jgi:transposase